MNMSTMSMTESERFADGGRDGGQRYSKRSVGPKSQYPGVCYEHLYVACVLLRAPICSICFAKSTYM